eukprot:jgi/Botrbrau1/3627/Bobra.0204s0019.1
MFGGDHAARSTSGGDVHTWQFCRPALFELTVDRHYYVRNGLISMYLCLSSRHPRTSLSHRCPWPWPGAPSRRPPPPCVTGVSRPLHRYRWLVTSHRCQIAAVCAAPVGRVDPQRGLPKTSRPAMLSCCRVNNHLWPSKPSLLKHLEDCMLMPWPCSQRLLGLAFAGAGLLTQATIAQEDVDRREGYFFMRRVSFIIAAALIHHLAARRV